MQKPKVTNGAPLGPVSGDVRLRERHVRSAGVYATEHAEDVGPNGHKGNHGVVRPGYFERL